MGFNAKKKAEAREGEPVTLDNDVKLFPRRKTNKIMRRYRAIQREYAALGRQIDALDAEADNIDPQRRAASLIEERDQLPVDSPRREAIGEELADLLRKRREAPPNADRLEEIEEERSELDEQQETITYKLLATLLKPEGEEGVDDDLDSVTERIAGQLEEELDIEDVRALLEHLTPGGAEADPQTPTSGSGSS